MVNAEIRVWDHFIRLFHWSTVTIFFVNSFLIDGGDIHRALGYMLASLLFARLLWGVIGTPTARFSSFWPKREKLRAHWQALRQKQPYHSLGHNPLGGLMIFALLGLMVAISITGWMMGWDHFWGEDWLETVHEGLANFALWLILVHITAVLLSDLFWKKGLLKAMLTGIKSQ